MALSPRNRRNSATTSQSMEKGSALYLLLILIAIAGYFGWPSLTGWLDVHHRRIPPDISATDVKSILLDLEPGERDLLEQFFARKRPNSNSLGDWSKTTTVDAAIFAQSQYNHDIETLADQLHQLGVQVREANQQLNIALVSADIKKDAYGSAIFVGAFANTSQNTVSALKGTVVFFYPPFNVRACLGIVLKEIFTPADRQTFTFILPPKLSLMYSELSNSTVRIDFVPTEVKYISGSTLTYQEPAALCPAA